ncbi:MAG: sulfite exporter TauE/SafE family protein [Candidatus Thermoplasmatota archaeon]|nr:sulfite exporter TauE/SafE family protein [Candidatus Thermoplasmatota archaeon]
MLGTEEVLIALALLGVAALYSSVGHGGASGYLAVLSLTSFATMEELWLKQHAWSLNLIVAAIAFYHYQRAGHHIPRMTGVFVVASIPMAFAGGYLLVNGVLYDTLLSVTLVWASVRLFRLDSEFDEATIEELPISQAVPAGAGIGLLSGIVGVGGGIFLSPLVLLKRWATPKAAAATAALFIWVNSAAALTGSYLSGEWLVELETIAPFGSAVLIGGFVGSKLGADLVPQRVVRVVLVVVLLLAAARRLLLIA